MEKVATLITPRKRFKHNEKGRPPASKRESLLDQVATITGTKIPRWCRYSESVLERALVDFGEAQNVRNKVGLMVYLIKKHNTKPVEGK